MPTKEGATISLSKTDTFHTRLAPMAMDTGKIISLIKGNPVIDSSSGFEIERTIPTNGGNKYVLISASGGTCHRSFLVLIDNDGVIEKCAELEANCDGDLSRAFYRYKNFTEESDTVFNIEVITQRVADTSLIDKNGHLKKDLSLDDVKCNIDTVLKRIPVPFLTTDSVPKWPQIWKDLQSDNQKHDTPTS